MHPAIELYGTSESWVFSHLDDACIDQLPMSLARTGAFAGCVSESGAHDMMGNLHEWTSNTSGAFRGGYYVDTVMNGNGCLYVTTAHAPSYHDYSTGFRCCADHP
jgi:formylglycine-generating enzyme required for sulfatase activity